MNLSFLQFLQSNFVEKELAEQPVSKHPFSPDQLQRWYQETGLAGSVFPSQGLLSTPFDELPIFGTAQLPMAKLQETLQVRQYLLTLFNHPERLAQLELVDKKKFQPPAEISSPLFHHVFQAGLALSIQDLGLQVGQGRGNRVSRRQILMNGPFIKLGAQARVPFSGAAMQDTFGAPAALATLAMCHALSCVPRNGVFHDIDRQVALVKAALIWMENEPWLAKRTDKAKLLKRWGRNLVGVLEPSGAVAYKRAEALFKAGIRAFRVYSPEPGRDMEQTIKELKKRWGEQVEIFAGQITSCDQAQRVEAAGADGIYIGVGGGGRCITAQRSDSVVNWPELAWSLRGCVQVPVIVEGGASAQCGVTLALGASGIGVSRMVAGGTIESPGGMLYYINEQGKWFKPYGGEASARTKFLDGKMLGHQIPAFVEGETTEAFKPSGSYRRPTLTQNILTLLEDVILSLVFRGVENITELQALDPSPIRQLTSSGHFQQGVH